jgi:hypothetical protein
MSNLPMKMGWLTPVVKSITGQQQNLKENMEKTFSGSETAHTILYYVSNKQDRLMYKSLSFGTENKGSYLSPLLSLIN